MCPALGASPPAQDTQSIYFKLKNYAIVAQRRRSVVIEDFYFWHRSCRSIRLPWTSRHKRQLVMYSILSTCLPKTQAFLVDIFFALYRVPKARKRKQLKVSALAAPTGWPLVPNFCFRINKFLVFSSKSFAGHPGFHRFKSIEIPFQFFLDNSLGVNQRSRWITSNSQTFLLFYHFTRCKEARNGSIIRC